MPFRPSRPSLQYMTGWKAGVNAKAYVNRDRYSSAYRQGYLDGALSRQTQWKFYPLDKEKDRC